MALPPGKQLRLNNSDKAGHERYRKNNAEISEGEESIWYTKNINGKQRRTFRPMSLLNAGNAPAQLWTE